MPECGVPYKPGMFTSQAIEDERLKKELERRAKIRDAIDSKKKKKGQ